MSKSVTVQFDDGTSHVYDDVPDNISDADVSQRASQDFSDKTVTGVNLPTEAQTARQNYENQNMGEKALGAVSAGANLVSHAATSPLGNAIEAGIGGKYAVDKIAGALQNRSGPVAPVQPQSNPAVSPRYTAPTVQPVAPTGAQSIIQKIALDKVLKNAGMIGAGMSVAQGLFGTSPEEIQVMKEAEARKRAQGWKPLNER